MLCAVTIPRADLRSLSSYYYAVCARMCMSSVRVWCSCLLVICFDIHWARNVRALDNQKVIIFDNITA